MRRHSHFFGIAVLMAILTGCFNQLSGNDWIQNEMPITAISMPSTASINTNVTVLVNYIGAESGSKLHLLGLSPTVTPVRLPLGSQTAAGDYLELLMVSTPSICCQPLNKKFTQPGSASMVIIPTATGTYIIKGLDPSQSGDSSLASASLVVLP